MGRFAWWGVRPTNFADLLDRIRSLGASGHADFAALLVPSVVRLKMAFIVVAPVLITKLSW